MIQFDQIYAVDGSGAVRGAKRKRPVYRLTPASGAITWCDAPSGLLSFIRENALGGRSGSALLVVDVPIGLPEGFAEVYAGHGSFADWLLAQRSRTRASFVNKAVSQQHAAAPFVDFAGKGDKSRGRFPLRRCDVISGAESVYWCVGGRQVGKAALQFWFDVLIPLLIEHRTDVAVWPFEDLSRARLVIAECYPALLTKRVWGRRVVKSNPSDVAEAIARSDDARDGTEERTRLHAAASEDDFDALSVCLALRSALRDGTDILAAPDCARPHEGWIVLLDDSEAATTTT